MVRLISLFILVLIPSITWAIFFYLQDRLEPEPLSHILGAFLAGGAAAAIAALPLSHILFRVRTWLYASSTHFVLGSFLITASLFSILIYCIIRFIFYPSKEFNEPVDGMVYGAMSGGGFAFISSLYSLSLNTGYTLFAIAYIAATNILIYSGVGSLIGYAMGTAKFKRKNIDRFSSMGIVMGIILLGIYHLLNEFIFLSGFEHTFWLSFMLTALYAFAILLSCYLKMRTLTGQDYHEEIPVLKRADPVTLLLISLLTAAGFFISHWGLKGKSYRDHSYGISFYYPHSLSPLAFSRLSGSSVPPDHNPRILFYGETETAPCYSFSVMACSPGRDGLPDNLAQFVEADKTESLLISDIVIDGKPGKRIAYSYLDREAHDEQPGWDDFPRLIDVYTDVIYLGDHVFLLTYRAPAEIFRRSLPQHKKILRSIKWQEQRGE
jgi:RsiW-degrading membrane proteinase PrsW (M82 family)